LLRDGLATRIKARAGLELPIDISREDHRRGTASARMTPLCAALSFSTASAVKSGFATLARPATK
jgi:hypothetical protein